MYRYSIEKRRKILLVLLCLFIVTGFIIMYDFGVSRYVDGKIVIYFKRDVNLTVAKKVIDSYNCTINAIVELESGLVSEVAVPVGEENKYIKLFEANDKVLKAERIVYR
jgi:hypothetical protein